MIIYFDESYDGNHKYLILGALFNPHPRFLHQGLIKIKKDNNFYDRTSGKPLELKYNNCINNSSFKVGCEAIDLFFKSTSYFRCVVIDQGILNLGYFGQKHEKDSIKMARAYKKFAELLLAHSTDHIYNGVLLTDELTRCKGDEFILLMQNDFCSPSGHYCDVPNKPTLKHISDIKSHLENYHINQINDILIGCVLNNLVPTAKEFKNNLRLHLIKKLEVNDLLKTSHPWTHYSKTHVETYTPKFSIWYWEPKNGE